MKRFILLALIGVFLTKSVTPSIIHDSSLKWLFGLSKLNENKTEIKEESRTVCKTQECEKFAKTLLESIDKSVDPCDDFYEYACGKWPEHNPIPEGQDSWGLFYKVQENVEKKIEDILDAGIDKNDLLAVKLAKKWYAVCMDIDAMDKQGLDPLILTLSRMGGWPMIMHPDEWNEQEYSWQKVDDQYMRLIGRNVFHNLRIFDYGLNETEKQVLIDTPPLPPESHRLWLGNMYELKSEEDKSDEDPSGEDKQSDEQKNSQEPGSEDKDDDKKDDDGDDSGSDNDDNDDDGNNGDNDDGSDNDDNDDDSNDNNSDDDTDNNDNNDDSDDDNDDKDNKTSEQDKDTKKKSIKKTHHRRNKKLSHSKKGKSGTQITKKHKIEWQREKRRATKRNSQPLQSFTHREKLHARKNKKNHVRKEHGKWVKKTLDKEEDHTSTTSTTPRDSTEETNDEDILKLLETYSDYVFKVARLLAEARGTEILEEDIKKDVEDMIKFQVKLVDIVMDSSDELELTLDAFQEWYNEKNPKTDNSRINWIYKVAELFDEANVAIDGDLNLNINSADYFEALVSLLDKTSSRTIVNYIHWNFLSKAIKSTTSEMRQLYYAWKNVGKDEDKDKEEEKEKTDDKKERSSICIKEVEMSNILAYEYVRKHFSDDITKTATDMVDDIQKEVEYQIKESDWMDEYTKDFVLAKLINMKKFIGYPDWYKNTTIVKRYFQGLMITNSYYENILSYSRYIRWKGLRQLLTKVENDYETWWLSPLIVNAYFSPEENRIAITAADFQSPLFAYSRPQAINYGIIGFVMAHEVNHGFDDTGHLYDKNGDFVEWLSVMAQAYGQRANCFVEQFNNYPVDPKSNKKIEHYGNQTISDNIADTMGLYTVYRAYQRRERECEKADTVLPGLEDLTNDQLFFLSFANLWCEANDPEKAMWRIKRDEHSTARLRVIGSVSNSEDFAKTYNCPVGSAMNPEKKCNIWK